MTRLSLHRSVLAATATVALLLGHGPATAQSSAAQELLDTAPEHLRQWLPWVTRDLPQLACARAGSASLCDWPGDLTLQLTDTSASFTLLVQADGPTDLILPGQPGLWPTGVQLNARPVVVHGKDGRPTLHLPAGVHRVTGSIAFARTPDALPVSPHIAVVRVVLPDGTTVTPAREPDGTLRLRERTATTDDTAEVRAASVEVFRLLTDDVPIRLETRLRLRVSGDPRTLDLGNVLPEGFSPTGLDSPIPARLDDAGHLILQLRPGEWNVTLHARAASDLRSFTPVTAEDPWPAMEYWSLNTGPARRAIEARSAPGVDPRQTALPAEWHRFPAFILSDEHSLDIAELSRGASAPPAERIDVSRDIRLAFDGSGFSIRDSLTGQRSLARRLEAHPEALLGRATLDGQDVVITRLTSDSAPGIEIRNQSWNARADLTWTDRHVLPATGWNVDAHSLTAVLHLPPGWTLLSTAGADSSTGWFQIWGLLDLFFLLIIVLGLRAIAGNLAAALALPVIGVAWHTPLFPHFLFLILIVATALALALRRRRGARVAEWLRRGAFLVLAIATVGFVWEETRIALYPQLARGGAGPEDTYRAPSHTRFANLEMSAPAQDTAEYALEAYDSVAEEGDLLRSSRAPRGRTEAPQQPRSAFIDPSAIVQTGPGMPTWQWQSHRIAWSGPVAADQTLRLTLLPPLATSLLRLFTVFGLLALLFLLLREHRRRTSDPDGRDPGDNPAPTDDDKHADRNKGTSAGTSAPSSPAKESADGGEPPAERRSAAGTNESASGDPARGDEPVRAKVASEDNGGKEVADDSGIEAADSTAADDSDRDDRDRRGGSGASTVLALLAGGFLLGAALLAPAPAEAQETVFPPNQLLQELRTAVMTPPACGSECVETARMVLEARGDELRVVAEVHVRETSAWPMPGPERSWVPAEVRVGGVLATAMRRDASGQLHLRLPPGVHEVVLRGPLRERVTLGLGMAPRVLEWRGEGWLLDGLRPDAPPPSSVHLTREVSGGEELAVPGEEGRTDVELPPSLMLERTLEIGIPWTVHYRLRRDGGTTQALRQRVPLLDGEQVVTDGVVEEDGMAVVTLERGASETVWSTTLDPREALVLEAAEDVPWMETWVLRCSTLWHCGAEGLVPVSRVRGETWQPVWMPWPGEEVRLVFERPRGVEGQTITVDSSQVTVTGGRRLRQVVVVAQIRASRGGRWTLAIPPGADVQQVQLGSVELPATHADGEVTVTLPVGASTLRVEFREELPFSVVSRTPEVVLEGGGANLRLEWQVPEHRWLLWTSGPSWGPVVTIWHWLPVLLILALVLGRWAPTPLGAGSWLLLGLGMTQVPWIAPLTVVAWLVLVGLRGKHPPPSVGWHNLAQVGLVVLTLLAFISLVAAVFEGLALRPPDMQVEGGGSWGNHLRWHTDRTGGAYPVSTLVTLPLWVWHVLMLAWALWLAAALVRWVKWGWGMFGEGGLWRNERPLTPPQGPQGPGGGGPGGPPTGAPPASGTGGWAPPPQRHDGFHPPGGQAWQPAAPQPAAPPAMAPSVGGPAGQSTSATEPASDASAPVEAAGTHRGTGREG